MTEIKRERPSDAVKDTVCRKLGVRQWGRAMNEKEKERRMRKTGRSSSQQ
jgi:hypothetical protein